jgi:hypothetical protein
MTISLHTAFVHQHDSDSRIALLIAAEKELERKFQHRHSKTDVSGETYGEYCRGRVRILIKGIRELRRYYLIVYDETNSPDKLPVSTGPEEYRPGKAVDAAVAA